MRSRGSTARRSGRSRSGCSAVLRARPTVVAVDDVQWLDHPSEVVLAFVARRLEGARVGLLVARRGGGAMPLHLPETRAGDGRAARRETELARLLAAHGAGVAAGGRRGSHGASGGNPYFALELVGHDDVPAGLRGLVEDRLGGAVAGGPRGGGAGRGRCRARPTCAGGRRRPRRACSRLARVGVDRRSRRFAAAPASRAVAHPALAYEQVADKRALHARAAALRRRARRSGRGTSRSRRTRRTRTSRRALVDAARRARARGAPDAAAELLEQARRLTPGRVVAAWRRGRRAPPGGG